MTDPSAVPTPPADVPVGVIVRPKIFPLAFLLLLFKPRLSIDGGPEVAITWSDNWVALPPGRHSLRVWLPYLFYRHMGDATVEVDVPAGGSLRAQWRSPWIVFIPGKWKVTPA